MSKEQKNYYKNYYSALNLDLNKVGSHFKVKNFIKQTNKQSKPNILEIGCGIGYLLNYLSEIGNTTGIDISDEAISIAKNNFPTVDFRKINIIENPNYFKDKKFDIIIFDNIIEHLLDKDRDMLLQIVKSNLLNDGGQVIFLYANPFHPVQLIWGAMTRKVLFDPTHVHNWTVKQFIKVVEKDFKIINKEKTSPFTKWVSIGKYFKGEIILFCQKQ